MRIPGVDDVEDPIDGASAGTIPDPADADRYRLVVVAASAGGVAALQALVAGIPSDFPVPVVIVQHLDRRHRSLLAEILARRTGASVEQARSGQAMASATIYVAPPDEHLLVNADRTFSLSHSELVHFVRPSADLLFESAAGAFGSGTIAVVLTGTGSDGAMGVAAVKERGGTVIAQDMATSDYFGMPGAAIDTGCVDFVLPLDEIAGALVTLVNQGEAA